MNIKFYCLAEIAGLIGCEIDSRWQDRRITGLAPLETANAEQVSFISHSKYKKYLTTTKAAAVITPAETADCVSGDTAVLICPDPYLAYAKLTHLFAYKTPSTAGIHPSAVIDKSAKIAHSASIGAQVVVEEGVVIGENVIVGPGCIIGAHSTIDDDSYLYARVTLYHHTQVGKRAILHSGAVLGADGFGFAPEKGQWVKIEQLGCVLIGDDVEIGANTTVDRGALGDTIIHNGVKLDNQIQIGHNVKIGQGTAIAGCTAVAGSTTIGRHCRIAGLVGIAGHLEITDGVVILGMSGVSKSILEPGIYASGIPLESRESWARNVIQFKHLNELAKRVNQLEKREQLNE
jgi:UDP-3-O-[3-hydroxymyristoyl] glucosamine N-acyltransferase